MGGQIAVRVDPAFLVLEVKAGNAEAVDRVFLARGEMAVNPHERMSGGKPGPGQFFIEIWQHTFEFFHGLLGVENAARIGVKGGRGERGGQQYATTVDNVGALLFQDAQPRGLCQTGFVAVTHHGQVNEPGADNGKGDKKQRAGHQKTVARSVQRLFGGAVKRLAAFRI